MTGAGRFAPSPTSALHLGNLRTALLAWLMARSTNRAFVLRIEDLDQQRVASAGPIADRQVLDLTALGIDFDPPVVVQSERLDAYAQALTCLEVYECYCSRRDIALAAQAPHSRDGLRAYPGTCRDLSADERVARRRVRPPALRVRARQAQVTVTDQWAGEVSGVVDDFVVRRNDGTYSYQLAVVVDDVAMQIDQVVRADDLLSSSPRQGWLATQLGGLVPRFAHVPLTVNAAGVRLAKRDGAVTLARLADLGWTVSHVRSLLAASLGLAEFGATSPDGLLPGEEVSAGQLLDRFDPDAVPREVWVFPHLARLR